MSTIRAAIIDQTSNLVVNLLMVDFSSWVSPPGFITVSSDTANIGDTYNGTTFVPPAPPPRPAPTVSQLIAFASNKQTSIAAGGISVNVGTVSAPVNVEASTDPNSLILLQGAFSLAQVNASASFQWVQSNSTAVTLTAAQVITIFTTVSTFLQSTFDTLASVIAAIKAGTMTTTAQIDTASWPVNS